MARQSRILAFYKGKSVPRIPLYLILSFTSGAENDSGKRWEIAPYWHLRGEVIVADRITEYFALYCYEPGTTVISEIRVLALIQRRTRATRSSHVLTF